MRTKVREMRGAYHLLAFVVVAIWGTSFVSTKMLLNSGLRPSDIFFLRFLLAYVLMVPFAGRRLFADSFRHEALCVLLGVTGGSLYFLTENMALQYSYCSNVSLIVCATPLLTTFLLGFFYSGERMRPMQWVCSLVSLLGMVLVVLNGHFVLRLSPVGDLLALAACILWSVYSLGLRVLQGKYSALFLTRKVFFYGLLTILPVFAVEPMLPDWSMLAQPMVWSNLLYLGVTASFLCYFGWTVAMARLGTVRATNYLYLNPLVTLITSWLVLNERITMLALVGAALILGGLYGVEMVRKRALNSSIH